MDEFLSKKFGCFDQQLAVNLRSQQRNGEFCDCTVIIGEQKFTAHKCVLAASSRFMGAKLSQEVTQYKDSVTDLSGLLSEKAFSILLEYMYSGILAVDKYLLRSVKEAAYLLELKEVFDYCLSLELDNGGIIKVEVCDENNDENYDESVDWGLEKTDNCANNEDGLDKLDRGYEGLHELMENSENKNGCLVSAQCVQSELGSGLASENVEETSKSKRKSRKIPNPRKVNKIFAKLSLSDALTSEKTTKEKDVHKSSKKKKKTEKNRAKCIYCPRKFSNISMMTKHKQGHEMGELYKCNICDESFARTCDYTRHVHSHSALKCEYCSFEANLMQSFIKHNEAEHDNPKPFACSYDACKYRTNKQHQLEKHFIVHSTFRPFLCNNCGRDFAHKNSIASHIKSCLMIQAFLCDLCGRSFNHLGSMKSHRRIHGGEKPHVCADCNATFSDHRNLKRHRRIHENIFPYVCGFCKKRFRHSNTLKMHINRQHEPGFQFSLKDFSKAHATEISKDEIDDKIFINADHSGSCLVDANVSTDNLVSVNISGSENTGNVVEGETTNATATSTKPRYICLKDSKSGKYTFIVGGNTNKTLTYSPNSSYLTDPSDAADIRRKTCTDTIVGANNYLEKPQTMRFDLHADSQYSRKRIENVGNFPQVTNLDTSHGATNRPLDPLSTILSTNYRAHGLNIPFVQSHLRFGAQSDVSANSKGENIGQE